MFSMPAMLPAYVGGRQQSTALFVPMRGLQLARACGYSGQFNALQGRFADMFVRNQADVWKSLAAGKRSLRYPDQLASLSPAKSRGAPRCL